MVPPRTATAGPSTERGEETRRRILELAARAIAEHGYRGVSLNDLIRRSGLTKGAFYFHFESKEALARAVYRHKQEQWAGKVMAAAMQKERAIERLQAIPVVLAEIHRSDPSARAIGRLCAELTDDVGLSTDFSEHMGAWIQITTQLLREAQAEGDVRAELDADGVARAAVAGVIGVEQLSEIMSGRADIAERIDEFMTLFLDAVRT